ncbi:hypothetical protein N7470_005633 [Penicillium chermesinum]|nr:hypothetical protein N7470_005633 [Penicillium chermesinum]
MRRQREKARQRVQAQAADAQQGPIPAWSLEHGVESDEEAEDDEDLGLVMRRSSTRSVAVTEDSPSQSSLQDRTLAAVEGSMYGAYTDYPFERRFSTASSSFGYAPSEPEWSAEGDDMAYVPCLTISEARSAFRDAVLGLEYLHFQGIIHRDIKPANLLVTSSYRVKISDFGVSYLGRPMHDEEEEQVGETDATDSDNARELSKTVGTPAFYAPELCYTGEDFEETIGSVPKITGAIDVWSLGVTLYGMVFGRLPFVSDDGYSMFQSIVKKEVFIPRKRLVPVKDHSFDTQQDECRDSDQLVYEEIDDELYDLLRRLLTKDPVRRITLKEIKHHPWTLYGLPNPRAWVEETDPGHQSKGKRIEVSNEEVTTAVSKVPFIQRVRSNVAKWFTGRSSKEKDPRKHTSTPSTDTLSSTSSSSTFGKASSQSRRSSLKGDEDLRSSRLSGQGSIRWPKALPQVRSRKSLCGPHVSTWLLKNRNEIQSPLPVCQPALTLLDVRDLPCPMQSQLKPSERLAWIALPDLGRVPQASSKPWAGPTWEASLSGSSRRSSRNGAFGSWSRRTSPAGEDGDHRSEPSVALSNASAMGQVRSTGLWHTQATAPLEVPASAHRRNRSQQLAGKSSAESFNLTKEALLRHKRSDLDPGTDDTLRPNMESAMYSTDSLQLPTIPLPENAEVSSNGLAVSTPSAATISSSSADDFTSGMSHSASHPSIPSVVSGASSLSGEGLYLSKEKSAEDTSPVPSILRTGETVKARMPDSPPRFPEEDESRYYCDDEDEYDDESEDEVLVIGKKKPTTKAPIPTGTKPSAK